MLLNGNVFNDFNLTKNPMPPYSWKTDKCVPPASVLNTSATRMPFYVPPDTVSSKSVILLCDAISDP